MTYSYNPLDGRLEVKINHFSKNHGFSKNQCFSLRQLARDRAPSLRSGARSLAPALRAGSAGRPGPTGPARPGLFTSMDMNGAVSAHPFAALPLPKAGRRPAGPAGGRGRAIELPSEARELDREQVDGEKKHDFREKK